MRGAAEHLMLRIYLTPYPLPSKGRGRAASVIAGIVAEIAGDIAGFRVGLTPYLLPLREGLCGERFAGIVADFLPILPELLPEMLPRG